MVMNNIVKSNIPLSAKQIVSMVNRDAIDLNLKIQRSVVWDKCRKSIFIESMIVGYPTTSFFAKCTNKEGKKVYSIIDGKQRISTVNGFLNDEFALTTLEPVTYVDDAGEEHEVDISGLKFSELPEFLKDHLNTVMFSVVYFDNLTDEEERELFKRLNNGKPLSAKSKLLASCKNIDGMLDIGSHELFDEMLTDKARDNKNQVSIVMKAWCMMNQKVEDVCFESKSFNPMIENAEITEVEKISMLEVFNLIVDTHTVLVERKEKKVAKKLYTETHMVSLVPYFKMAVEDNIDAELMADWLVDFFGVDDAASVSEDYNNACANGSAKNVNIIARHDALAESYTVFFKDDDDEDEDTGVENEEDTDTEIGEADEVDDYNDEDNYESADGGIWADIELND